MKRLTAYLTRLFVTDARDPVRRGVLSAVAGQLPALVRRGVGQGPGSADAGVAGVADHAAAGHRRSSMSASASAWHAPCRRCRRTGNCTSSTPATGLVRCGAPRRSSPAPAWWGCCCCPISSNLTAYRRLNLLSASVAADLVSSTLKPGRFTQVTPGVVLLIGGRSGDGEIQEFFADDRRDPLMRRTYIAESARVSTDGENYVHRTAQRLAAEYRAGRPVLGGHLRALRHQRRAAVAAHWASRSDVRKGQRPR